MKYLSMSSGQLATTAPKIDLKPSLEDPTLPSIALLNQVIDPAPKRGLPIFVQMISLIV
jgi:hypothetical protein